MFKAIKDNKIIAINETGEFPLLNCDIVEEDTEHSVSDYTQINGEYVLTSSAEAIEQKKADVRAVRNQYLKQTDEFMIVDYPITNEECESYKQYRTYLRTYPESKDWYKANPKTYSEWLLSKQQLDEGTTVSSSNEMPKQVEENTKSSDETPKQNEENSVISEEILEQDEENTVNSNKTQEQ